MEPLRFHKKVSRSEARQRALELLEEVGIRAGLYHRQLPPPVFRRHAPARNDRHGADQ
jgi:predicted kinase